jgi:hypothetical protein
MVYETYTNRNPVWIIWFAVLIPDIDFVAQTAWEGIFPYKFTPIIHGEFHNIFTLVIFSVFTGWYIWKYTRTRFFDATLCVALGFTAHLVEDALTNGTPYYFYAPFSDRMWYQGYIIHPSNDIIFANNVIASTNLIYIGVALIILAMAIRCILTGNKWLDKYTKLFTVKEAVELKEGGRL